ncbi:MAG: pyruvate, phosphate dikinase [Deltaproteobacteria bacterium]|nr:pyruvate, phosphate dikinase [Deltaproteobacteria bacterium]
MTDIYRFSPGTAVGDATMTALLGLKGASLAELCRIGVKTPPGFTLTTEICKQYFTSRRQLPEAVKTEVRQAIAALEQQTGKRFGDASDPLLVSVRAGAKVAMPGALKSVINVGLNEKAARALGKKHNDPEATTNMYHRFIAAYGEAVYGMDRDELDELCSAAADDDAATLQLLAVFAKHAGRAFPESAEDQLFGAIGAAFESWRSPKAERFRVANGMHEDDGVACTIQAMVYGCFSETSGAGVLFTRDANTGDKRIRGEFLQKGQGDELRQGVRTPLPFTKAQPKFGVQTSVEEGLPKIFAEIVAVKDKLEAHFRDMLEIELTVENGELYVLQTRAATRSPRAALKVAVDLVKEGITDERTALLRVEPDQIEKLLHPNLDPEAKRRAIAKGLPASPGAASGAVVFNAEDAIHQTKAGRRVVLVRNETTPEDIHGMNAAQGVLTARGGMTSHSAVVARGLGRSCVVGCSDIRVDYNQKIFTVPAKDGSSDTVVREGDVITIDGSTGEVILGEVRTVMPQLGDDFTTLIGWADKYRKLAVRANADTPKDAEVALAFGAEGIGLCRTEHMFYRPERVLAMRELILAREDHERKAVLKKLLPMQRGDFVQILTIMRDKPVTVRLLDPPLHEFLPNSDEEVADLAKALGMPTKLVRQKRDALREMNPMLGHRGARLGITWPELYQMQVRALCEAACELKKKGIETKPEIMVPLVMAREELAILRKLVLETIEQVSIDMHAEVKVRLGAMIEVPRAALVAKELGALSDFFSFGTNDLTQAALGVSRDDAGKFLGAYVDAGILERDPFVTIDREGVGELMRFAVERGRAANPTLELGICGEHGSDTRSIAFSVELGLDYVSCSPYRVAAARLAAARAAL